jgi:spermidine synthase
VARGAAGADDRLSLRIHPASSEEKERDEPEPLTLLLFLFGLSGVAGLAHEVAWSRALGQVLGGSLPSQAIVLGTYLFGLGAGAAWAGRRMRPAAPLRAYARLELVIALWGAAAPWLARAAAALIEKAGPSLPDGGPLEGLRLLAAMLVLLPGTGAMGATFPVLLRALPAASARTGPALLYGVNTLAGASGALLGSFALLPLLGTRRTFWAAALLNLAAAIIGGIAARRGAMAAPGAAPAAAPGEARPAPVEPRPIAWRAFAAAAFASGVAGALMQFGWTRAMTLAFGSSIYALGLTLSATLFGLGIGPLCVAWLRARPRDALEASRSRGVVGSRPRGLASGAAWTAGTTGLLLLPLLGTLPALGVTLSRVFEHHPVRALSLQFTAAALLLLVPALAQGAAVPLFIDAMRDALSGSSDDAALAARAAAPVYAASTWGTVAGFLLAGFLLVPRLGARRTLVAAALVLLVLGLLLAPRRRVRTIPIFAAPLLLLLLPGWNVGLMSAGGFLYGPLYRAAFGGPVVTARAALQQAVARRGRIVFEREDGDGLTTVRASPGGTLSLQINGKTEASSGGDMPTQLLAGHLPLLLHPDAQQALVIGLASGVSLGAVERHPVRSIRVIEIARGVPEAARRFDGPNHRALDDPRVRLVVDDARAWLLARDERYDVIVSQPSNPWVAGVANLFTREFYRLARARLREGGVMAQWVQAYRILPDDLRGIVRSFLEVFPDATLWEESAGGGDLFLVGGLGPRGIDPAALARAPAQAWADLGSPEGAGPVKLLTRFVTGPRALAAFAEAAPPHTDDALTLEWRAPLVLFHDRERAGLASLPIAREPVLEHLTPSDAVRDPGFLAALDRSLSGRQARLQAAASLRDADLLALREPALAAGLDLLLQGRAAEAAGALARAAAAAPDSANAHYLLGLAYRDAGLASAARVAFEQAVEIDPGLVSAWTALGTARFRAGDLPGARAAFLEAAGRAPDDPVARNNIGTILLQEGNLDAAEAAFRAAARDAPWLASARANLGVVARRRGDLESAERELRAALALDPHDDDARFNLDAVLKEATQRERASPAPR